MTGPFVSAIGLLGRLHELADALVHLFRTLLLRVPQQLAGMRQLHFAGSLGPDVPELAAANPVRQFLVPSFLRSLGRCGPRVIKARAQSPLVQWRAVRLRNQVQACDLPFARLDAANELAELSATFGLNGEGVQPPTELTEASTGR